MTEKPAGAAALADLRSPPTRLARTRLAASDEAEIGLQVQLHLGSDDIAGPCLPLDLVDMPAVLPNDACQRRLAHDDDLVLAALEIPDRVHIPLPVVQVGPVEEEAVPAGATSEAVVAAPALQTVVSRAARDLVKARVTGDGVVAAVPGNPVRPVTTADPVASSAAGYRVVTGSSQDFVGARSAAQHIVACSAVDVITSRAAIDCIVVLLDRNDLEIRNIEVPGVTHDAV